MLKTPHATIAVEDVRHIVGNPDGVDADSLDDACNWIGWGSRPSALAAHIWPTAGPDRTETLVLVRDYMSLKCAGMRRRERGEIQKALRIEAKADEIYETLPEWAKW